MSIFDKKIIFCFLIVIIVNCLIVFNVSAEETEVSMEEMKVTASNEPAPAPSTPESLIKEIKTQAQVKLSRSLFDKPADIIGKIINFMLAPLGAAALILYIYAGFLWMTSAGNATRVETAQKIILWVSLGVAMALASYIVVDFVFKTIAPVPTK